MSTLTLIFVTSIIVIYSLSMAYLIRPLNEAVKKAPSAAFRKQKKSIMIQYIMIEVSMVLYLVFALVLILKEDI